MEPDVFTTHNATLNTEGNIKTTDENKLFWLNLAYLYDVVFMLINTVSIQKTMVGE